MGEKKNRDTVEKWLIPGHLESQKPSGEQCSEVLPPSSHQRIPLTPNIIISV